MTVFETLNAINVNDKVETKGRLKYLSWAYAWGELKKRYPNARYTVYENGDGWNYHHDGRTAWVKTGVTIDDIEYIEYLPVMDNLNRSIPMEKITSFDVNKAIQRSLTKRIRRHGLGLYIYRSEDLPDVSTDAEKAVTDDKKAKKENNMPKSKQASQDVKTGFICETCEKPVRENVARRSKELFDGHIFCSKECRSAKGFKTGGNK